MSTITVELSDRIRTRDATAWKQSPPLFLNRTGVLAHRVHSVGTFNVESGFHHSFVTYLCANGCSVRKGVFLGDPGEVIVCARCEQIAKHRKLPSIDELVGRHCHIGSVKSFRTCCLNCCQETTP